jgi:hypothetical protein
MHGPVLSTTLVTVCLALFGLGCAEEVPPHFESGTWASTHRTEIENDCDKRVLCASRTNEYLRDDAFEHCVETNATNLNRDPNFQFKYSLGLLRCKHPDACQYVGCADSTFVSYGQSQIDKINYVCEQHTQCGIAMNSLAVPPMEFYESCRLQSVVNLDAFPTDQQTNFQTQFFVCMPQVSCAFLQCFPH